MKKYLLPSALILVFGLGMALAQNITKAIQLSQDPTGAFGVDTSNNVYFPAHVLNSGGTPTLGTNCSTATITGSDVSGRIVGVAATAGTCTVTFKTAFLTTPFCIATTQNPATSPLAYNVVPTGLNLTTITGAVTANYICSGQS